MPPNKKTPQDIYAEELSNPERGYPLYIPEPYSNLPEAYRNRGIQIGDVGIIRPDGGFEYFFSIACTENNPINKNRRGVPDGFEVYSPFVDSDSDQWITQVTDKCPEGSVIRSAHISQSAIEFNGSASLCVNSLHPNLVLMCFQHSHCNWRRMSLLEQGFFRSSARASWKRCLFKAI
jgi:hypothetical protein